VIDLGSGAGFPGMVLAMMGLNVQLVESDQRKAVFLREVSRETKTPVIVHSCRIEALQSITADVVTARALAPLKELISHMQYLKISHGVFLKGENIDAEIHDAKKIFDFEYKIYDSLTDKRGKMIIINSRFT
jgi:16S rRNA (guanine527-N7)-methyltransferase